MAAGGMTVRSSKRALAADGAWHLYEWDLNDRAAIDFGDFAAVGLSFNGEAPRAVTRKTHRVGGIG